jgi:hypothetical protein
MIRRLLAVLAVATAGLTLAGAPATAAGTFSGRVVDSATGTPLAGVTVSAGDLAGAPVGSSVVTGADGTFTLAELAGEEYSLIVTGTAIGYESGYVGAYMPPPTGWSVFPTFLEASTWAPMAMGDIALDSRTFSGRIVDSATGTPLAGATVTALDTSGAPISGASTTSAADGTFTLSGGLGEEHGLAVDGTAIGYESGYVGMVPEQLFGRPVVATFLDAVTWAPRDMGDIGLDSTAPPLTAPGKILRVRLTSPTVGALQLTVTAPRTGGPVDRYVVSCKLDRTTNPIVRSYTASGQVQTGFLTGKNRCDVWAENDAGSSPVVRIRVTVL